MINNNIFREYDIRGVFEKDLNEYTIKNIGYFLSKYIDGEISIGYDARTHSNDIFKWLISGLNEGGIKVVDLGLIPTPLAYFSVYQNDLPTSSIMITGSHNPKEYNGLKITIDRLPFFGKDLQILKEEIKANGFSIKDNHAIKNKISIEKRYIEYIVSRFDNLRNLNVRVAFDAGNGMAPVALNQIIERLNLKSEKLFFEVDGNFPNHHPDPSIKENLLDLEKAMQSSDIGFAYDGDCDRVVVMTKKQTIKNDELALIFARNMKDPSVITEVKCSTVIYNEISKIGKVEIYKTGHSNIKIKLKDSGYKMGAEISGHMFFNDENGTHGYDDGIYATFRVLELIKNGVDLDDNIESIPLSFKSDELKSEVSDDTKFEVIEKIRDDIEKNVDEIENLYGKILSITNIDGVRVDFKDGFALIRASNTTPSISRRYESKDSDKLGDLMSYFETILEKGIKTYS